MFVCVCVSMCVCVCVCVSYDDDHHDGSVDARKKVLQTPLDQVMRRIREKW
jgi:hypothetical protein